MTIDQDIRVVGLDLDSTLLKDDKTISEYTRKTLEEACRRGIYVMPATGRTRSAIPECVESVNGIRYAVCSNGASVVDLKTGEEFYSAKIDYGRALELYDMLDAYGTMFDCYIEGDGYTERRFFDHLDAYGVEPHIQTMIKKKRNPVDDLKATIIKLGKPVEKFNMFFLDLQERDRVCQELSKIPGLKITSSLRNNLEINAEDCNKGAALLGFAKRMGFTREQVMCCGDGNNDYDMVCMCGVGVAMMNAVESLKEAADYITYSNEEDGVAKAIERLCMRMQDRLQD